MGLFDYLRCEYPLPRADFEGCRFQTKDTDAQYLDDYKITADGRLLYEEHETETVLEEERPGYQEYLETGKDFLLLRGCIRAVNKQWVDTGYHGDIEFYGGNERGEYATFLARFTNGQVEWIREVDE